MLIWLAVFAVLPSLTSEEVLAYFGFDERARSEFRAGAVVSTTLEEGSDTELAVAAVMLVPRPLEEVFDAWRKGIAIKASTSVVAHVAVPENADAADLTVVGFTSAEVDEVKRLLDAEPGDDFNLGRDEIDRFRELGDRYRGRRDRRSAAAREAVSAAYRELLLARLAAYREKGLDGVARYEREDDGTDAVRPARELRAAAVRDRLLAKHDPALHGAFVRYPRDAVAGVEHRFYCIKRTVDERPALILAHHLSHRVSGDTGEWAVVVEREFYVGHTYDGLQAVTGFLPVEGGTLVYYHNRTSTDRVAGFGKSIAHRVGPGRIRDAVESHLASVRDAVIRPK